MPRSVSDTLAQHVAERPASDDADALFTSRTGRGHMQQSDGRTFARAAQRAGLPAGTTSHDRRHHYASVLIARGVPVVDVASLLRHENATLVINTYAHLMPGSEDRTRAVLDAAWAPARPLSVVS